LVPRNWLEERFECFAGYFDCLEEFLEEVLVIVGVVHSERLGDVEHRLIARRMCRPDAKVVEVKEGSDEVVRVTKNGLIESFEKLVSLCLWIKRYCLRGEVGADIIAIYGFRNNPAELSNKTYEVVAIGEDEATVSDDVLDAAFDRAAEVQRKAELELGLRIETSDRIESLNCRWRRCVLDFDLPVIELRSVVVLGGDVLDEPVKALPYRQVADVAEPRDHGALLIDAKGD
jgi:hypothetical protein